MRARTDFTLLALRRGLSALVLAFGCLAWAAPALAAAKPAPKVAHFDPRDFSGQWENAEDQQRTFDPAVKISSDEKPPLKEPWLSDWKVIRERVRAGMKVWDPDIACLPPGMPRTMNMSYPFEIIMQPKRVTMLTEYFNETRRVFMDGRSHPKGVDLEPTFRGHSIGHWDGATLVIDTVGVRPETMIDLAMVPHSDQMHVVERARRTGPNDLQWTLTLEDPVVLAQPWTVTRHFVRSPADSEIREYVCAENNQPDKYAPSPDDAKYQHSDPRLKTQP